MPPATAAQMQTEAASRPVQTPLELQVELHRRGFSCGSIDGVPGAQTAAALRAYQATIDVPITGVLDAATKAHLELSAPALTEYIFTAEELASVHPVPPSWLEKSQLSAMTYGTALEMVAEKFRAAPAYVKRLNPTVDWAHVLPGVKVIVPAVERIALKGSAARIVITLSERRLQVFDAAGLLLAQFPVSIARMVEKRPVGTLHTVVVISNPDYTFDPALYPESPEAKADPSRKLVIPPGPNNPVGLAWIGLDRPGYGIHGTPEPENVGRTESHGCFRLANWDVLTLLDLVPVGIPVDVEP